MPLLVKDWIQIGLGSIRQECECLHAAAFSLSIDTAQEAGGLKVVAEAKQVSLGKHEVLEDASAHRQHLIKVVECIDNTESIVIAIGLVQRLDHVEALKALNDRALHV